MKTLLLAALVALLVVPVVGNANQHKCRECEEKRLKPKYNQAERAAKAVLANGVGQLKLMENFKIMMDAMDAQAKNAPDKLQKDWALGAKANLAETYNKTKRQFNKTNKDYLKAVRNLCNQHRIGWGGGVNVSSPFGQLVCMESWDKRGIIFDQRYLNR
jgi:hypothetical protein